jgi:hypothetical protein
MSTLTPKDHLTKDGIQRGLFLKNYFSKIYSLFYNNAPITVEQKNLQFFSSQNFKLPQDFSIELSGFNNEEAYLEGNFKSFYSGNF